MKNTLGKGADDLSARSVAAIRWPTLYTGKGAKDSFARSVSFSCRAPEANAVFVAGSFNDWMPDKTPLRRQPDGLWSTTLSLLPKRHEFKFIVDGQWCCELGCEHQHSGCSKCVPNTCGTMNRFVDVT